jgi:hypothetical protein
MAHGLFRSSERLCKVAPPLACSLLRRGSMMRLLDSIWTIGTEFWTNEGCCGPSNRFRLGSCLYQKADAT